MGFDDYCRELCAKQPGLKLGGATMKLLVGNFRRYLERAYPRGRSDAIHPVADDVSTSIPPELRAIF